MPESSTAQPAARPEPWILLLALALAGAIQVTRAVPAQADGSPQSLDAYLGGTALPKSRWRAAQRLLPCQPTPR